MKAVIIAAGMGTRLRPHTEETPKVLLPVGGQRLLDYQLAALREAGIEEVALVRGFRGDLFTDSNLTYYENREYEKNNILASLFCAEAEFEGGFLAAYSDILYRADIVEELLDSKDDIAIAVDRNWKAAYDGRTEHPMSEAENVRFDSKGFVTEIGKHLSEDSPGEFIGMLRCTAEGAEIFSREYETAKRKYKGKPFMAARDFQVAYITDFVQYLVNESVPVSCSFVSDQWLEVDTVQDLERAQDFVKTRL